jgi:hypothetical protein
MASCIDLDRAGGGGWLISTSWRSLWTTVAGTLSCFDPMGRLEASLRRDAISAYAASLDDVQQLSFTRAARERTCAQLPPQCREPSDVRLHRERPIPGHLQPTSGHLGFD